MAFLVKDDFNNVIRGNILDQITSWDDTRLTTSIAEVIEYMKGQLNARYDVDAIFSAVGSARNPLIVMYAKDIVLYNIHSLINPRKIPDHRVGRYEQAKQWINEMKEGMINQPDLPELTGDDSRNYVKFGGNTKRENHV